MSESSARELIENAALAAQTVIERSQSDYLSFGRLIQEHKDEIASIQEDWEQRERDEAAAKAVLASIAKHSKGDSK